MLKRILSKKIVRIAVVLLLALIAVVFVKLKAQADKALKPLRCDGLFTEQHLGATFEIFDIGVADVNDDDLLDVYTVNHSVRQRILINDGHGEFSDQLLQLGLSQHTAFPGLEPTNTEPEFELPGLYIYWHKSALTIRAHDFDAFGPVTGQILIPKSTEFRTQDGCKVKATDDKQKLSVDLEFQANGQLALVSYHYLFMAEFRLSQNVPIERVYIGADRLPPSSHEFVISVGRDRHGMAWADFNGDGRTDVFVVRGGGLGKMKPDPLNNNDELLIRDGNGFADRAAVSGIVKDVAPGRRVGLVDFDGDGLLDIYAVCGRGDPPRRLHPNQLHRQKSPGQFVNVADDRGLGIPKKGAFVWLDVESDGDMDLFWADDKELWLYTNQSAAFEGRLIGPHSGGVQHLTVADYDSDGDLDVLAVSAKGNALLNNSDGKFRFTDLQSIGIPARSFAAQWVDYDNDGKTDLFLSPDGIFRQNSKGQFEATHLLAREYSRGRLFCTWFDADNNGTRDLLIAIKELPSIPSRVSLRLSRMGNSKTILPYEKWNIILYRNIGSKNHWLQFQLIGPEGNRPAIGAVVELTTPDGTQLQQVGQADGSIRSQGHYRLYFGLGQHQDSITAKITWPNGRTQELTELASDQLLTVKQELLESELPHDDTASSR